LALVLQADLATLLEQVREKWPFVKESDGRAILFLDDVHLFGQEFLQDWFGGKFPGSYGFGSDEASRAPVVMTLALIGAAGQIVRPTREFIIANPWLALLPLGPFPKENDQDLMACEQVLLNPYDHAGRLKPGVSNVAFALNYGLKKDDEASWNDWSEFYRDLIEGKPINFTRGAFYGWVKRAQDVKFVLEADDEVRVAKYMKGE
jgi:hypothetical protein